MLTDRSTESSKSKLCLDSLIHEGLLGLDTESGVIHFAGRRALLMDAEAMGVLRKNLVERFGTVSARAVLTQFGYAHGWRSADALDEGFTWENEGDWMSAGARIPVLEGLFRVAPESEGPLAASGMTFSASYEAEQHLAHFGQAESPVCWTICGLISGYLSRCLGKEIFALEDCCVAAGDPVCHLRARTREAWGEDRSDELGYFEPSRLEVQLESSVQRVLETLTVTETRLKQVKRTLNAVAPELADDPSGLIARSGPMRKLVDFARRVAKVETTVLILGESGVGKERIARLVHDESSRAHGPFIGVNCGAITETLLESELFGHARGAFTGASHDRAGYFEAAHRGTILLDEIGEISPALQVKLLRVLQEREVRRVGENKSRPIDVRVLSATNLNLAQAVIDGVFRQDLYYRLNVIQLEVPPLRERHEDLLPLARILLILACRRMQREPLELSPQAADQLLRYDWPGNVRELENAMERGAALSRGSVVSLEDLPEEVRRASKEPSREASGVRSLDLVLREHILAALARNEGNQTRTAAQLGIGTATLYRKLKSYGVSGTGKAVHTNPE